MASTAEAKALFDEAMRLTEAKRYDEACPKFERSLKLDYGIGTHFYLADCYEHIGRLASAYSLYDDVAYKAADMKSKERAEYARKRADALGPRLVKVLVDVPEGVRGLAGLVVERGGVALVPAQWATPLPVDPGRIVVAAVANGKKRWETSIDATREGAVLVVTVPALEDAPISAAPSASAGPTPSAPASAPPSASMTSVPAPEWSASKKAGVALLSGGGAGVIAGAILGALVPAQQATIKAHCQLASGTNHCDRTGGAATDMAFALANGSNVGFAIGAVLVAAGGGLLFFGGDDAKRKGPATKAAAGARGITVGAVVTSNSAGAWLRGRW